MIARTGLLEILAACLCMACAPGSAVQAASSGTVPPASPDRPSIFTYPWIWTDEGGGEVTFSRWRGDLLVLAAIYTSCRTRCPRTIAKVREIDEALRRQGRAAQVLLVTLDPGLDTPERLRTFKRAEAFPPSWHLLAGSVAETRQLADLLNIHVIAMDAHLVHNSRILVCDAEGIPQRTYGGLSLDDEGPVL